ncbi:MAG: RNA 2',3'-cyclic phosphodiesterase [Proteobacteria bacterium]|nr:RNA 2',3'-cyclic phosphodiesterase [Pseudomonadota bacterium]
MRAFLAMEISDDVKKYLKTVIKFTATHIDGVKWVNEAGQHITLKFFGEIEDKMAWQVKESILFIERKYAPFAVTIKSIDAFPDRRRARVIVITLENGVDNIKNIYNDIEESILTLGIEKEKRPFAPHITIGRRKMPVPLPDKAIKEIERISFVAGSIVLFKSTLRPEGALYTPVWELNLKGSGG